VNSSVEWLSSLPVIASTKGFQLVGGRDEMNYFLASLLFPEGAAKAMVEGPEEISFNIRDLAVSSA
jgi:hypothetical protein